METTRHPGESGDVAAAATLLALVWAGSATAQVNAPNDSKTESATSAATDSGGGIQEVLVTAQRREESVQKSSVVVSVVDPDRLERAGITQPQALTSILPGVQIGTVGPTTQVYIRGIGDFGSTAISNPAVAFNVDGVYVGRSQSLTSEFYDIARVEVLKGPQGTLYGRNASGGAINLITARPDLNRMDGHVSAEIGNFDSQTFEGALNVPLSSTFALRASGQIVSKGGYTSENFSDDEHQSARLKALWEPSEDASLLLNASYGHVGGDGGGYVLLNRLPNTDKFLDVTSPEARAYIEANQFFALPPGAVTAASPDDAVQDLKFWNFSAELNWDLGFAELTVLPAYRDAELRYASMPTFLYDVGPAFGNVPERPETSHQTSVETRLSKNSDRLKWVAGVYYYDEDQYVQGRVFSGFIQNVGYVADLGTRSYAAFGQATLSLTDKIRIIGGARETSDRRSLSNGATYAIQPAALTLLEDYAGAKTFHNVSWKAGVEADLSSDSLLFATASTGFKAGGFNQLVSLTAPAGSNIASSFQPEKLTAYEIGLKNTFLDRRLQLNVEGFYWDYKDHQEAHIALSGQGTVGLVFENAGSATIYGASADLVFMPFATGTLHAGVELVHSRYDDFSFLQTAAFLFPGSTGCAVLSTNIVSQAGPVVRVDCSGNQLTRAPKWSGNAGYTQIFHLYGGNALEASVDLASASKRWLGPDFVSVERADAYVTFDASLTYRAERGISLTAFVRNLTNEAVYTGAIQSPFSPGVVASSVGAPRTYGARAEFRF
jgi:iron complex outermembrane receptor protein